VCAKSKQSYETKNGNTMTSNEELIAEARKTAKLYRGVGHNHGIENTLDRLADALEAASQTRVVDNIRDLAVAPRKTIVRVSDGTVVELGDGLYLQFGEDEPGPIAWLANSLPATILYAPPAVGEEAGR
jgi:hypothetical protein